MGRSPSTSEENGLKKGPWTPEEDEKLREYISEHGIGSWRALPRLVGLNRCGKSCRLRWMNYLRPEIKRGSFSEEEERLIIHLHSIIGNRQLTFYGNLARISNHHPLYTLLLFPDFTQLTIGQPRSTGGQKSQPSSRGGPTTKSRTSGTPT